jgi:hypothetical protein
MSMQGMVRSPSRRWLLPIAVLMLAAAALTFLPRAAHYLTYTSAAYGHYWPRRVGLALHITGGVVALLTGLAQVWLGLSGRTKILHRWLGRIYAGGVGVGAVGGYYMALTSTDGATYGTGLFFLATAWVITTTLAWQAARHRLWEQHREWMLRSYTVTFAFVVFRLGVTLLVTNGLAPPGEAQPLMAWACWSVPLLLLEPLLQYRKLRRR